MTPDEAAAENEALIRGYQLAFGSPAGQAVLIDLASFCRAAETCVVPGDHDRTYVLEGRREVWLRIQQFINLTPQEVLNLTMRRSIRQGGLE